MHRPESTEEMPERARTNTDHLNIALKSEKVKDGPDLLVCLHLLAAARLLSTHLDIAGLNSQYWLHTFWIHLRQLIGLIQFRD